MLFLCIRKKNGVCTIFARSESGSTTLEDTTVLFVLAVQIESPKLFINMWKFRKCCEKVTASGTENMFSLVIFRA